MAHQESALRKKSERKGGGKQSEADRKGRKIEAGDTNRQAAFSSPGDTSIHHDYTRFPSRHDRPWIASNENIFIYG